MLCRVVLCLRPHRSRTTVDAEHGQYVSVIGRRRLIYGTAAVVYRPSPASRTSRSLRVTAGLFLEHSNDRNRWIATDAADARAVTSVLTSRRPGRGLATGRMRISNARVRHAARSSITSLGLVLHRAALLESERRRRGDTLLVVRPVDRYLKQVLGVGSSHAALICVRITRRYS